MQYLEISRRSHIDPAALGNPEKLDRFIPWDHNCTFELAFPKRDLRSLDYDRHLVLPFEVGLSGASNHSESAAGILYTAAANATRLSEFGVFFFGTSLERKDRRQTPDQPSSVEIVKRGKGVETGEGVELVFTYCGSQAVGVESTAEEAKQIMLGSGLVTESDIKVSWWSVRARLEKVDSLAVQVLSELVQRLGSGKIFHHYWDASLVGMEDEIVNKHGFDLYNRVAESGLTADEIKVLFKLQFLDMRGLNVVRQLCEGDTHYTIPLGTFRHRKKRATVGVFTSAEGYRLALDFKETPTQDEFRQIEAVLGQSVDRNPCARK